MILLVAIALSIAVGLIRGGKLTRIAELPLVWGGWALLAFGGQWLLFRYQFLSTEASSSFSLLRVGAVSCTYLLLLAVVWRNRHLPGMGLIGLGLLLNGLVIMANGGYMPISPETLFRLGYGEKYLYTPPGTLLPGSKDIILPRELAHLWFLGDVFVIPPSVPFAAAFSIGDVFIAGGVFLLLQSGMMGLGGRESQRKASGSRF